MPGVDIGEWPPQHPPLPQGVAAAGFWLTEEIYWYYAVTYKCCDLVSMTSIDFGSRYTSQSSRGLLIP